MRRVEYGIVNAALRATLPTAVGLPSVAGSACGLQDDRL
jgi:hypothetical protein